MSVNINSVPIDALMRQSNLYGVDNTAQQRINKLLCLFDYSQRFKEVFTGRWKRNYEYYHNIDRALMSRPEHQSKIFVPRPYLIVETKVPRLVQGVASKDPMYTISPVSGDDIRKSKISQELLTRQWRSQDNGLLELTNWIKDSFIYGLGIAKSGWEFRQEMQTKRFAGSPYLDPMTGQMVVKENLEQELVTTVDRPFFKNIDIAEFFWDPQATTIEDCKFMIHKYSLPRHTLEEMQRLGAFSNVDKIPKSTNMPIDTTGLNNRQWSLKNFGMANVNSQIVTANPVYQTIEILECWWIDGNQKMKTMIADRNVIIQDIPIPYWHQRWPFYQLKDTPLTGEFVGLGEIDPIADLVMEMNDIRNQQNDNRNQFLKAFWVANRSANVDLDALENMPPGGILEVTGDPNAAITVLRPPSLDSMTLAAQQQIDSDIQMTTGANDIAIGTPTRSQIRTATTGSMMAESTNTRFSLTAMLYLEQMRKIGRDWLALDQQFMTQPVAVKILGQDGLQMEDINAIPHDIPQQYDLYVTMGSELQGDQDIMRQQSIQLFQILAQVPGFQITEYAKELLGKFNEKNPERFFEGSQTVPTYEILNQLGVGDKSVNSSFQEQMGGLQGGGTQAISRSDLLQTAKNPSMVAQ